MKGKNLLGGLLMAILGAVIALFAYTAIIEKPVPVMVKDSSGIESQDAKALLTSFHNP